MHVRDWIFLIIFLVITVWIWWKIVPRCVYLIYPNATRCYFDSNPDSPMNMMNRAEVRRVANDMERLGFHLIGAKVERVALWGGKLRELSLASSSSLAFASIFVFRGKPIYYFYTPFSGGGVVLTANAIFAKLKGADFIQTVVPFSNPEKVLAEHKEHVQEFIDKGLSPFQQYTRETRVEATYHYYSSHIVNRRRRIFGAFYSLIFLIWILVFVLSI